MEESVIFPFFNEKETLTKVAEKVENAVILKKK